LRLTSAQNLTKWLVAKRKRTCFLVTVFGFLAPVKRKSIKSRPAAKSRDKSAGFLLPQERNEMKIYITCVHDRHTDDKYRAFKTQEAAENHIRGLSKLYKWDAQENHQYGDFCLFMSDDYYMFWQEVELLDF
jgi:hypothetical protein